MNKIIWIVSTNDPTEEDIRIIDNFVSRFNGEMDIKTDCMRVIVKETFQNGGFTGSITAGEQRLYMDGNGKPPIPLSKVLKPEEPKSEKHKYKTRTYKKSGKYKKSTSSAGSLTVNDLLPGSDVRKEVDKMLENESELHGLINGKKTGAVNNSGHPTVKGRQPWVRCTGCGGYDNNWKEPGTYWMYKQESLHIGLCSGCEILTHRKNEYFTKVKELAK